MKPGANNTLQKIPKQGTGKAGVKAPGRDSVRGQLAWEAPGALGYPELWKQQEKPLSLQESLLLVPLL